MHGNKLGTPMWMALLSRLLPPHPNIILILSHMFHVEMHVESNIAEHAGSVH